MDDKKLDKEIRDGLLENTKHIEKNKEEIWKNIEARLQHQESENKGENIMKLEKRTSLKKENSLSRKRGWITGSVAAALLIGVLTTTTDTGQAFIDNVKEYFAPQKQVVEEIEGMPEENEVNLQESKAGYIIYINEDMYKMVQGNESDRIIPKEPLGDRYPEVSMEISQVIDKAPEVLVKEIQEELSSTFTTVKEVTSVEEPVKGILVSAIDGNEWDSKVSNVYILSNEKDGSFIIRQNYFLEAAEGHGARFYHMLKEFKIVENSNQQ
jgi:hypothetical protein